MNARPALAPVCTDCSEPMTLVAGDFRCVGCDDADQCESPVATDVIDFITSKIDPRLLEQSLVLNPEGWYVRGSLERHTSNDVEAVSFTLGGRKFLVTVTEIVD
jgi:hypothetical protein